MRKIIGLVLLSFITSAGPAAAHDSARQQQSSTPPVAISEAGVDAKGNQLYSVIAGGANIADILSQLLSKMGVQYKISEDVNGPLSIRLLGQTSEQVLREISEAARPPLRIERDAKGFYRITREAPASALGVDLGQVGLNPPPVVPLKNGLPAIGYAQFASGSRPVTFSVPREQPIPLAEALKRISAQVGVPIRLDPRVPKDVEFSGNITRTPLAVVLQYIANTADLKLITDANGATFTPPDRFIIRVRDVILGTYTDTTCPACGFRLSPDWRYCPNCSRITPIGERDSRGRGAIPKRPATIEKINRN